MQPTLVAARKDLRPQDSQPTIPAVRAISPGMAEKVKKLNLERDYKKNLYFIDGNGNVCSKSKSGEGETKVLVEGAVERDNQYLYFLDKDGDVSRSPRGGKKSAGNSGDSKSGSRSDSPSRKAA